MIPVGRPCISEREVEAVAAAVSSGQLTQAGLVEEFEKRMAEWLDVEHAVAVSSGTAALHLSLAALEILPGDEVLVPDLSFVATANAVSYCGATPVLVETDAWGNMDAAAAERKLSPKTRAIIVVHLYGRAAEMDALVTLASFAGVPLIEDAAEGLGGKDSSCEVSLGTIGEMGCFSFYGNKLITTGEGGMIVCHDENAAKQLRFLRGQALDLSYGRHFYHSQVGFNYRMTEMQAALGLAQLERIGEFLSRRKQIVKNYSDKLNVPRREMDAPWLFTAMLPKKLRCPAARDRIIEIMLAAGIETRPVFVPMHRLPMYRAPETSFPNASRFADAGLSLPTFFELTDAQIWEVCTAFERALKEVAG